MIIFAKMRLCLVLLVATCCLVRPAGAGANYLVSSSTMLPWQSVFENIKDSVVQIFAFGSPYNFTTPFKKGDLRQSRGSGFLVERNGQLAIVTNYHVVEGADILYLQHPGAWKELVELEFIGGSPECDVAYLAFKPGQREHLETRLGIHKLACLTFGDSDAARQGQEVMLVGYPLGHEHIKHSIGTISGHASGSGRGECFTTTAVAYPGNSGGCCVNQYCQVIGILAAGYDAALNMVLPIKRVAVVLDELADGKVMPPALWGWTLQSTTLETFKFLGMSAGEGALVAEVIPGSLSDKAGLRKGDIIMTISLPGYEQPMPVDRFGYVTVPWTDYKSQLNDVLGRVKLGATVTVAVWRSTGQVTLDIVKTTERPFKVTYKFLPFDTNPDYEVFGGMVVMELTMNHLLQAINPLKALLKKGDPQFATYAQFFTPEKRQQPCLIITHIFAETELMKNRVFGQELSIVAKVNGVKVSTMDEYRAAVLVGADTGYVTVETVDGAYAVLDVSTVLRQEPYLAQKYNYPLSPLFTQLVKTVPE